MITTIEQLSLIPDTLFLIVSDHGRDTAGKGHGEFKDTELTTIWMALGGDIQHQDLNEVAITPENTAPTALHALGIPSLDTIHGGAVYITHCFSFISLSFSRFF